MKRTLAILLLAAILMGLCTTAFTQETREATFLSQALHKWSEVKDICIQGNNAYLAVESGLSILDISDTTNPQEIGFLFHEGGFGSITMQGNYAYLSASGRGIYIADVSNPYHCFISNTVTTINGSNFYTSEIQSQDNYLYTQVRVNNQYVFAVFNIIDPVTPVFEGTVNTSWNAVFTIEGNYLYYITNSTTPSSLTIIDTSNPNNLHVEGSCILNGTLKDLAVSGNYVYVTFWDSTVPGGIYAVNVISPSNPQVQGICFNYISAGYITISGNYAFLTNWEEEFIVADISNPTTFVEVSSIPPSQNSLWRKIAIEGNYAFCVNYYRGMSIIDITTISNMHEDSNFYINGWIYKVKVVGNYAYVSDYEVGLRIVDISNPALPILVGSCLTSQAIRDISVHGDYAFLFMAEDYHLSEILVVDIANPAYCTIIGSIMIYANGFFEQEIAGDYIFLVDNSGLRIIDISNPAIPQIICNYDTGSVEMDVAIQDNNAYVATDDGIYVVDVSNPYSPTSIGFLEISSWDSVIDISGNSISLVTTNWYEGPEADYYSISRLRYIDVSNPTSPYLVQSNVYWAEENTYISVRFLGDYVFIGYDNGIDLIYSHNPAVAEHLGYLIGSGYCYFDVQNSVLFAPRDHYLGLYDFSSMLLNEDDYIPQIEAALLEQNCPNPFVQETSITYDLTKSGDVRLSVYNTKGQLVRQIVNELQGKGPHMVSWDGTDSNNSKVASGVYFYRLETQDGTQTRKCLLLK